MKCWLELKKQFFECSTIHFLFPYFFLIQIIVDIACRVLEEPILSSLFLMEDQAGGIGMLLKSTKKDFPFSVLPYIQLLKSLCTDADSADIVSLG